MATQDDYIRTALRVPPGLHAQIHEQAKSNNRTFNAEIIARLQASFNPLAAEEQDRMAVFDKLREEIVRDLIAQIKLLD